MAWKAECLRDCTLAAAWNRHDAKAMASMWAEDGDLINPFGRVAKGREQVEQLFRDEHEGVMKDTTFQIEVQSVRTLPGGIALVDSDWKIMGQPQAPPMPHGHLFQVMHKQGGKWMTVSARPYSFTPPPGQPRERPQERG